eukprot:10856491-Lingulodinium_polyedra.AAC.1
MHNVSLQIFLNLARAASTWRTDFSASLLCGGPDAVTAWPMRLVALAAAVASWASSASAASSAGG